MEAGTQDFGSVVICVAYHFATCPVLHPTCHADAETDPGKGSHQAEAPKQRSGLVSAGHDAPRGNSGTAWSAANLRIPSRTSFGIVTSATSSGCNPSMSLAYCTGSE